MSVEKNDIVIYQSESGAASLEVHLDHDTVWLTQKQMSVLFGKDVRTVNEHIRNIFKEEELDELSVIRKFRISPESCTFRLIAHGPIQEEATTDAEHRIHRDNVAAMEMALAEAMTAAGYAVINSVKSRKTLDDELFSKVSLEFARHFPMLLSRLN